MKPILHPTMSDADIDYYHTALSSLCHVCFCLSGDDTGDTSSGRSPVTKDVLPPPAPGRPLPPHRLPPPQVSAPPSPPPTSLDSHLSSHHIFIFIYQVAVRGSAHTLSVPTLPLTLTTLLLLMLMLSPWQHGWPWQREEAEKYRLRHNLTLWWWGWVCGV